MAIALLWIILFAIDYRLALIVLALGLIIAFPIVFLIIGLFSFVVYKLYKYQPHDSSGKNVKSNV